ncbi:MAG: hypothetical protein ACFFB5_02745 [Promethearchaeota archaeon]
MNEVSYNIKPNEKFKHNLTAVSVKLGIPLIEILTKISVSTSFDAVFKSITELIIDEIPFISKVFFYLVDHEIEIIQCIGDI